MGYEENGIFMTYLKKSMENRNILLTDMLERLKQHFKKEIPIEAKDQMPITSSSLAEPLSLYDPVDGSLIGTVLFTNLFLPEIKLLDRLFSQRFILFLFFMCLKGGSLWNDCQMLARSWKELPQKQIATVQANGCTIIIYIQFGMMDDCFSNGLRIELTTEGYDTITFQPSIHPPILGLLEVKHQLDLKKCTITLQRLQALVEDASLLLRIAEFPTERILVHLGQPLISVARLSTNYF
jgi:hypothetical protein